MIRSTPTIRHMRAIDATTLAEIDRADSTDPWTPDDFDACHEAPDCVVQVAEVAGKALGFLAVEIHEDRLRILNIGVSPKRRRRGIGTALVESLERKLRQGGWQCITLEIRESNLAAQLFFRECGFTATGVLKDYFTDENRTPIEDGYRLELRR